MACYSPWSKAGDVDARLFACGKCHGCRLEHARQWGVRMMHEASLHDQNCFITLTYRDPCFSLVYTDFQLFMKRLRARFPRVRIAFYVAGEYGELNSRAHWHACLFNIDFPDRVYFSTTAAGSKLYRSKILEELWPHGFSSVGAMTFASAAYVARYCMSLLDGDEGRPQFLGILDPDTGEIYERRKEFARMSLRPAIGKRWLLRFRSDVYPHGKVVVNGHEARAPRYYDKLFRALDAGGYMTLAAERAKDAGLAFSETVPNRLGPRAAVAKARANLSKRVI